MSVKEVGGRLRNSENPKWAHHFAVFMLVIVVYHLVMNIYSGDSITMFAVENTSTWPLLVDTLKMRYREVTSRTLIELFLFPLSNHVILWKIANIAVYALLVWSLMRITDYRYSKLVFGLWLIYPVYEMSSAGWIATYMNYLWPLAFSTYAMISLKKIYCGERVYAFEWVTFLLAFLFAGNVEQMNVLILCVLIYFGIDYYIIGKRKDRIWFFLLAATITAANLIYIIVCPGRVNRAWFEVRWMHDYGTLSIIDKGVLGVNDTVYKLLVNPIFLLFVIALFILGILDYIYKKPQQRNLIGKIIRLSYIFPLVCTFILIGIRIFGSSGFSGSSVLTTNVINLFSSNTNKVDGVTWINISYYTPFIVNMAMLISINVALLNLFDDERKNIRLASMFFIGLITHVMMGLSPTLYASNLRTFIFFDAMMIYVLILMYDYSRELRKNVHPYITKSCSCIYSACVVLSVVMGVINAAFKA